MEYNTYERITLDFSSTLVVNLLKTWDASVRGTTGTLKFLLFNEKYEMSMEALGKNHHLPTKEHGDIPN